MQKILIIEDDHRLVLALAIRLEREGFEVMFETKAESGVRRAVQGKLGPDLVLLDTALPGGGGSDVALQLRENEETAGVPIIFITADRETHALARAHTSSESTELMDRVMAILRRDPGVESSVN